MKLKQGELIALHRSRKGWTQDALGRKLFPDLKAPHVKMRKIEAGIQEPKDEELNKIAKRLDVPVQDLMNVNDKEFVIKEILNFFPDLEKFINSFNLLVGMDEDKDSAIFIYSRMNFYIKKIIESLETAKVKDIQKTIVLNCDIFNLIPELKTYLEGLETIIQFDDIELIKYMFNTMEQYMNSIYNLTVKKLEKNR